LSIVVGQSRALVNARFGSLSVVLAAALINGLIGAHSGTGRTIVGCVFGIPLVLVAVTWFRLLRSPDQLEISDEAIRYTAGYGRTRSPLLHADGASVRFVMDFNRFKAHALYQPASGKEILLPHFRRDEVQAACEAQEWDFVRGRWVDGFSRA
jgi:hypothetical protein